MNLFARYQKLACIKELSISCSSSFIPDCFYCLNNEYNKMPSVSPIFIRSQLATRLKGLLFHVYWSLQFGLYSLYLQECSINIKLHFLVPEATVDYRWLSSDERLLYTPEAVSFKLGLPLILIEPDFGREPAASTQACFLRRFLVSETKPNTYMV